MPDDLRIERIAYAGLAEIEAAPNDAEKAAVFARIIVEMFNEYYIRSRRIPWLAKQAFETRNWRRALELSQERIAIFGASIGKAVPLLKLVVQENDRIGGFWNTVEERYRGLVRHRYEADLALAYLNSVRRHVYENSWMPVSYHRGDISPRGGRPAFLSRIETAGAVTPEIVRRVLAVPGIGAPWRDIGADAALVAARINDELGLPSESGVDGAGIAGIDVVEAGFYRNRGAYIVGGIDLGGETVPLALALLHSEAGLYVDAVILRETTLRHVFSSTLANFHVTVTEYHELVDYLHSLMPARPRGMHYSTVGYNHVGKLAVMEQITDGLERSGEAMDHAPGPRGSVAIGFTSPSTQYVLKLIRDKPTENYKWDRFDGIAAVLDKYRRVHGINRSGSMLDNINYINLSLPREMFADALLEDLMEEASETVSLYRDEVFFAHLVVQRKLIPIPLYLADCSPEAAEMAVIRLGQCIRNNAASNVFNKDLDGRNYGVSTLGFVYLFDYDAVETLSEIKVRTNLDREDGEEDIPDWFFEDGPIFLPEELEAHLRLPDRGLRRLFREAHGELLTVEYWTRMQRLLSERKVPRVRTYPRSTQLRLPEPGVINAS